LAIRCLAAPTAGTPALGDRSATGQQEDHQWAEPAAGSPSPRARGSRPGSMSDRRKTGMAISDQFCGCAQCCFAWLSRFPPTAPAPHPAGTLMPLTSWSTRQFFPTACQLSSWGIQRLESTPAPPAHSETRQSLFQALQPAPHFRFRHGCRKTNFPQCVCLGFRRF